ncbi:hypothetical protein [Oceanibaculum indicum]|uniref:hypothetical protein n=1 Tax=Oceanibaculum indicum TaxID=526216 RepID=UPI001ED9AE27|nr:hypothetical protein [Oceanibaculum indicum]
MPEPSPTARRRMRRFLGHLADTGNVSAACRLARLDRRTAYQWRGADADFRRLWQEALDAAVDALEAEARRRAVEGVEHPHFHQGQVAGTVKRYSDALLMFLLRAHRPERFRERPGDRATETPTTAEGDSDDAEQAARAALERRLDCLAAGRDPQDDPDGAERGGGGPPAA